MKGQSNISIDYIIDELVLYLLFFLFSCHAYKFTSVAGFRSFECILLVSEPYPSVSELPRRSELAFVKAVIRGASGTKLHQLISISALPLFE